ncbi:hypothetical protein EYR27_12720 [Xanthomonas oryzae]|nr:hypothetical protein EYR27_12720 [Xanthomonas oryzae]
MRRTRGEFAWGAPIGPRCALVWQRHAKLPLACTCKATRQVRPAAGKGCVFRLGCSHGWMCSTALAC